MKKIKLHVSALVLFTTFINFPFANAQFTPGNIVVLQTKGTASKGPSQAILKEFTPGGTAGITVAIDSTSGATTPFLTAGQFGGSEGFLTTSNDNHFLVLGGYGTYTVTADITATTAANIKRVVGKVDASGTYTQMYTSNTFYSANDIRGAISDGTNFWAGGASVASADGIDYFGPGAQIALAVSATPPKAYGIRIFNNQIYYSTQKAGPNNTAANLGICSLGSGMPTTGPVTVSAPIVNTGTNTPQDFSFSTDGKTCYVAINLNTAAGGIQKWTNTTAWATSGWAIAYTLGTGAVNIGAYGIVVDYSGTNPIIYATTTEAQAIGNRVIKITDAGAGSAATTLVGSVIGTTNKGISFTPCSSAPTSVSASSNSAICANTNLNLTASATGAVSFFWSGPNSFTAAIKNPTINNASTAATGIYTLTTTNACGSSTATTSVTINALPTAYTITGGGSYCQGGSGASIGLSNSDIGINYQLKDGATNIGSPIAGTGTVIAFPNQTTASTYSVLAVDAITLCTNNMSGNAVVTITSTVTPSITISASPSNIICSGTNVTFSATPTNGGGAPSYQWTLNGTNVGTNSTSYSNNALANNDVVVCTFTSNAVCATSATALSNTITINVTTSVVPALSIVSTTGNTNCDGTNITFSATPTNGGGTPSYQWTLNGSNVGTSSATYSNNLLNDQDVVGCTMTSSNGCASPTTATATTLTMTVIPNVTPSVVASANPAGAICAGTSVTFSASPTNGGTPSYQWTKNGSNVGSNSTSYVDAALVNGDIIICTMTSNAACRTSNTAASSPITMTVNANPSPSITGALSFCPSSSTTLDAGAGYAAYLWSNTATTQTISVSSAGNYSVTVSDGTCSGSSSTVTVTALSSPTQPAPFTTSSISVVLGQTGVAYTVPNDPTVTYNWNYSGTGATINGTSNSVTIDFSGSATSGTLSVTATNNCGTSSATTISINVVVSPSFGTGNLVLLQTSGTASKFASPITLKEITTSGATGMTVSIPSAGSSAFQTAGIFGGSEGFLTTSTDQKYLVLTGYSTAMTTGDITATSAASAPRSIGVVYPSGFFQQVYSSTTDYDANDIRGAVSDGTNFWASGASAASIDGIDYFGPGTPTGLGTGLTPPKGYAIRIFNGQIYYSTQKAGPTNTVSQLGIFAMGSGLPTSGSPAPTQLINTGSTVVEDFSINPTTDICYIAVNLNTAVGGIQKWTKTAGVWSLAYTLGTGVANIGAYGIVVDYSGSNPIIYATTFDAGGNRVIKITDTGAGSTASTILAAAANVYYKGITFAPVVSGTPLVNLTVSQDTASETARTVVLVKANTSAPVTGTQTVALTISGTNITTGDYTISSNTITIPAGSTSGTVTFTVVDDAVSEAFIETAILTIGSPSSGIVLGSSLTKNISIQDNEGNNPPSIVMNVAATTDYIDGAAASSPASPYSVSGTQGDPTDPAKTLGIDFTINDLETVAASLTVTVVSSNTLVVPNGNIIITGSGASRNVKITPVNIGYANISITVTDGVNNTSYVIYFASSDPSPNLIPANTFWHTGLSDASDAIAIDDNYYMTGDDELDFVNVYSRANSGLPVVSFDASNLLNLPDPSKPEADLEAAAESPKNANRSYWLGSMSNGKAPFANKPNRDRLFATHHTGTGAATNITFVGYSAIKTALLTWGDANGYGFTASAAAGVDSKQLDGFSAEGMVFAPDSTTLWIGLRAPLVPTANRTKAVIAPILNFETWFNNGTQTGNPTFGPPIELDLNVNGIRDIIRLSNGTYIILAGSPLDAAGYNEVYKWTGNPADAPIHVPSLGGGNLNMEGAMEMHTGGNLSFTKLQVISDYGGNILYGDAIEAKDFGDLNLRKFRSDVLTGLDLTICTNYSVAVTPSGSTSFCQGGSVALTASATASTYSWSTASAAPTITVTTGGNYTVTASNSTSGCSVTATTSVTVNALPNVQALTTATAVCNGQPVTLSGGGATTYTWTNSVSNGIAFTPTNTAVYTVTGTDANTCVNTATVSVTVNPLPSTPTITAVGNVLTSSPANTYQWYYNGSIIGGATSQSYTATLNGTYEVAITDINGCSAMSNTVSVNSMSIVSLQNNSKLVVKPNPFENYFEVEFTAEEGNCTVELYNSIGEKVATLFTGELTKGNTHFKFNSWPELQNGIYLLKIQNGNFNKVISVSQVK